MADGIALVMGLVSEAVKNKGARCCGPWEALGVGCGRLNRAVGVAPGNCPSSPPTHAAIYVLARLGAVDKLLPVGQVIKSTAELEQDLQVRSMVDSRVLTSAPPLLRTPRCGHH